MIGAFNSVYTALQGFLSRDFWTALFAPVALFAAIHAAVAAQLGLLQIGIPDLVGDGAAAARNLVLVALGLVMVGYLLQPLMPLFRGALDGSLLPASIREWLRVERKPALVAEAARLREAFDTRTKMREFARELTDNGAAYRTAYKIATQRATARDRVATERAEAAVALLGRLLGAGILPLPEQLTAARTAMLAALAVNNPYLPDTDADGALSLRTDQAGDALQNRANDAVSQAETAYDAEERGLRIATALQQPRATALGDARFVAERYPADVYAVQFGYLWPRLVLALRADAKDDPCNQAIQDGRARCDFAILSVMLTASVPLLWLPAMVLRGGPGWLFLILGGTAPVVMHFFYRLAFEAQLAFAEVIKTTIDRHRFLVLHMMSQALPTSRDDERDLWVRLQNAEQNSALAYLPYAPAPAPR